MKKFKLWVIGGLSFIVIGTNVYFVKTNHKPTTPIPAMATIKKQIVTYKKTSTFDELCDEYFRIMTARDPESISYYGNLNKYGIEMMNDELTDISDDYNKETIALSKKILNDLYSYDKSNLTSAQKLSYDILELYLKNTIDGEKFMYNNYIVNQFNGVQLELIDGLISYHNISNVEDAKDYILRLSKISPKIDLLINEVKIRQSKNIIPPGNIIYLSLNQAYEFCGKKPTDNELYTSFVNKLSLVKSIDKDTAYKLCNDAENEIVEKVYPAYNKLIDLLEDLKDKAPDTIGVWQFPNGDEYYKYILKKSTSTDLTPEEAHNMGIKEVKRLQDKLKNQLKEIGYTSNNISDGIGNIYKTLCYGPEIVDKSKEYLNQLNSKISTLFNILPQTKLNVEPVPKFREKTYAPAAYSPGSLDGSRPGVFYVNTYGSQGYEEYLKHMTCHEGIPGHYLQISIQNESKDIPIFRKNLSFTGFVEGWATYAEELASEYGFYDPYTNISETLSQLGKAGSLVLDTGIHYKKWTRNEALDFIKSNLLGVDIDRFIAYPGQACSYTIGKLKIIELREKSQKELGNKFNIKDFHDVVLKNGQVPFSILEKQIDSYITEAKKSK